MNVTASPIGSRPASVLGSTPARILVIDADDRAATILRMHLDFEGHDVTCVGNVQDALLHVRANHTDLVVADIGCGDAAASELLDELSGRPLLVLTAEASAEAVLRAFRTGADDYVTKPFRPEEVAARVWSILRRAAVVPETHALAFDRLGIDVRSRRVTVDGGVVETTAKEFDLLAFLAANPGRVYTRHQLLTAVWQSSSAWQQGKTVTEHVRRVRAKLHNASGAQWIETVRGVGYRFEPRPHHLATKRPCPAAPTTAHAPTGVSPIQNRWTRQLASVA